MTYYDAYFIGGNLDDTTKRVYSRKYLNQIRGNKTEVYCQIGQGAHYIYKFMGYKEEPEEDIYDAVAAYREKHPEPAPAQPITIEHVSAGHWWVRPLQGADSWLPRLEDPRDDAPASECEYHEQIRSEVQSLREKLDAIRDDVLNDRGPLAECGMTSDQTNAVLAIIDDHMPPVQGDGGGEEEKQ